MKLIKSVLLGAALAGTVGVAAAQEQYIPILSYRVGPYAAGGSGFFGGSIDYFNLVNANGGINGVKIKWEECETIQRVPRRRVL
jgi:branched-chain amino acid transport system substrate-binding protein